MKLSRFLPLAILFSAAAVAQQYPGAIVTDSQLGVAANNCGTTLAQFVNSTATTFTVASASCILTNMWMTIDSEIVHVCSVNTGANTFQVGVASCPNVDGRAYDGTSAATHNASAAVTSNIDAGNHNAVAAELKALEAALGVSLANVAALIPNPTPINKGGTGAATQAAALAALLASSQVPIANGGTGASTQAAALAALLASSQVPIANGGTGAATQAAALAALLASSQVPIANGGTGASTQSAALAALLASSQVPIANGGTGAATQAAALAALLATSQVPIANGGTGAASKAAMRTSFGFPAFSSDYNFTAQSPAGSLSIGNNTITLSPCPLGVAWNDTLSGVSNPHKLWIAGTGTPEAAAIVTAGPGTCTSGAASGTVTIAVVGAHANGYTVASATGGVEEALFANKWGRVEMPCSAFHIQATIVLDPTTGIDLGGCGRDPNGASSTVIINDDATGTVGAISLPGTGLQPQVRLHDFTINCNSARTCGTHVDASSHAGLIVERLWLVNSGVYGLHCSSCVSAIIRDNVLTHNAHHGLYIEHASNQIYVGHNAITDNSWTDGFSNLRLTGSAGLENLDVYVVNNDLETCGGAPAHGGVTTCFNAAIDNSFRVHFIGNYVEIAKPASSSSLYCGANVRGLTIDGNRFQDGAITLDTGCIDWEIRSNDWANFSTITTGWTINTPTSGMIYGRQSIETGSGATTFNVVASGTAAATAGAATLNAQSGTITSEALVTAAGSIYTLTLTDSTVAATSVLSATAQLGTATTGIPQIVNVTPGAGSVVIKVKNIDGAAAFNGTIKVQFTVSNIN